MKLTSAQNDRAAGVLLGQACGDALGVPYEFATPPVGEAQMLGGGLGPYAPGEWSDDTQMAICIGRVAATGADLTSASACDEVAAEFEAWRANGASDIGTQTSAVLRGAVHLAGSASQRLRSASAAVHGRSGRSAGNGALMRTGVVGLTRLLDRDHTAASARALAELTHFDWVAGDSAVLWSEAVRLAVLHGRLDLAAGLDLVPGERREQWRTWVQDATGAEPKLFNPNGYTVTALQAAWAAITSTDEGVRSPLHLQRGLQAAVKAGNDTDTVAAIAGALLGARYGASAVPFGWRRVVHGWPGLRARDLISLGVLTATGGGSGLGRWPLASTMVAGYERACAVPHPHDPEVLLGTFADLSRTRELGVDAVVSLCRLGVEDAQVDGVAPGDHLEVWLIDSEDHAANQHLTFVLDDAAGAVEMLRAEGKRVLLHCVAAEQRTPSVALRYAVRRGADPDEAARALHAALPSTRGRGRLWELARRD
jgi:ADP-ribosyl-[dinitrogen reductase] hydrolase